MKTLNLLFISLLLCIKVYAQRPGDFTQGTLNELIPFDNTVKQRHGSNYLLKGWSKGKIRLKYKGKIKEFSDLELRYDLANQHLEVKFNNGLTNQTKVKVFNDQYLDGFEYRNAETKKMDYFEKCKKYKLNPPLYGFFKVLVKGKKIALFERLTSYVQKGNEFKTLGIGSPNERIIQKREFYVTKGDKTYKIKRRKKTVLALFGDKKNDVKAFARENDLFYKSADDLSAIFKYYDGLK
ncbi:hypothetical protein BKI52_29215 [marine bacterium AO1-C]|nr:hypothetical protein BKI52_29215 [marine bacterium AO1-C]